MKDKLKIAMLGHKRIPSREGGVEIVVQELSTRMVSKGQNVTCYNRCEHNGNKSISEYKGVKIKNVFTIKHKGLAAITSSFVGAIYCALKKYDVIHFHAEGPCAMLWIPKVFGKKCIATIHGLDWQREKWGGIATRYIKFGEKIAAKYADEIIVLSKNVQDYFMKQYGRNAVFIPNGVNVPEVCKADLIKNKWGLNKNDYILFLGRLVPEKGIKYLIKAYKKIHTDKKLVIAGASSDTDIFVKELKEMSKDDNRIIYTGFVKGQVLDELYSNAYIYTLPSDLEGMPISLLEAMSYGNCCLVSDIPECAEVVEDKAVMFKKGSVEDLCEKLQMLCDNENYVDKYKSESQDYVIRKYNWDDVVNKTLDLYKRNIS